MSLRLAFVVALGVSGIVLACGGSAGSGGGAAATDTPSFISEFCALYAPCCGKVNKPTDGATCRALYTGLLGNSQYDSAKGNACLSEMRAQSNAPDFCESPSAPSCKGAFKEPGTGTAQPGENCSADGDCAASAEGSVNCASIYSGTAVTKSCQVELEGKQGDAPCIGTRDGNTTSSTSSFSSGDDAGPQRPAPRGYICDLARGIYCNSKTKACALVQNVGGDCETSDRYSCPKTAFCDSTSRTCEPRVAIGGDCKTNSQSCAEKTNCDSQTKKCVAGLADGTACTTNTQCASDECVNGKCAKDDSLSNQFLCGN